MIFMDWLSDCRRKKHKSLETDSDCHLKLKLVSSLLLQMIGAYWQNTFWKKHCISVHTNILINFQIVHRLRANFCRVDLFFVNFSCYSFYFSRIDSEFGEPLFLKKAGQFFLKWSLRIGKNNYLRHIFLYLL